MDIFKKGLKTKNIEYNLEIQEFKSNYRITAEVIWEALGEGNYKKPYNCMTRLRANIIDKQKVNIDNIKKIPLVKGINWNGPELQIIIGSEVPKVLEEFKKYELEDKNEKENIKKAFISKPPMSKRFLAAIVGIIQPAIAVIIAGGMLVAIYSLLSLDGGPLKNSILVTKIDGTTEKVKISIQTLYLFGVWDSLFFILANTVMPSIGVFFIYNTARYFDANPWFAITIGLFLLSQGFFPLVLSDKYEVLDNIKDAQFGSWISDKASGKNGFFLFAIGTFPIVIMGYQGSIIPYIIGGLLVVFIDKWIKTWMPAALDITFRGLLVILSTMLLLWFVLAPIANIVEFLLFKGMTWVGTIPFGIGTALFTALWQPLVIIGCHTPLGVMIDINISQGTPQLLGTANVSPYWGQLGAVIALGITTKNINLRKMAFATVPAGIFGITEPIIYGVNLPRIKPFIFGCLGSLVGGFLIGILDIDMDLLGTFGILSILRFNDHASTIAPEFEHKLHYSQAVETGLLCLIWLVIFSVSFAFTFFCYKERTNEQGGFKKTISLIAKKIGIKPQEMLLKFSSEADQIKAMKNDYRTIYNYYGDLSKIQYNYSTIETKENAKRSNMYNKLVRIQKKLDRIDDEALYAKFTELNDQYKSFAYYDLKNHQDKLKKDLIDANAQLLNKFNKQKDELLKSFTKKVQRLNLNEEFKTVANNRIYNSLESIEIAFDIKTAKNTNLKNKGV